MTEAEIREIFARARSETSAKEADLTLVLKEGGDWVLLFRSRGEELAIRISEATASTSEDCLAEIRQSLMRLS